MPKKSWLPEGAMSVGIYLDGRYAVLFRQLLDEQRESLQKAGLGQVKFTASSLVKKLLDEEETRRKAKGGEVISSSDKDLASGDSGGGSSSVESRSSSEKERSLSRYTSGSGERGRLKGRKVS
jgi:hypothetical protein